MEASGANKTAKQWLIYFPFAFFPFFLSIVVQFAMRSGFYAEVVIPKIPAYLAYSIPILAILTFLELYVAYKRVRFSLRPRIFNFFPHPLFFLSFVGQSSKKVKSEFTRDCKTFFSNCLKENVNWTCRGSSRRCSDSMIRFRRDSRSV